MTDPRSTYAWQQLRKSVRAQATICGLCGDALDRTAVWPSPDCTVVDHIVNVSDGGTNDPTNVRASHNRCNASRAATEGHQRRRLGTPSRDWTGGTW